MNIRLFFTNNLFLKITSLIIAIILWISYGRISGEKTITHIDIAPTYSNLPEGFEIVAQDIGSVRLRIQGSTNLLKRVSNANFSLNIDLGNVREASNLDIIVLPLLDYPSQIEILEVNPSSFEVFVDKTLTRDIPLYIESDQISNIPYGKRIERVDIIPGSILAEGPQSEVSRIESIGIKPLSIPQTTQLDSIMVNGQLDLPSRSSVRFKSETRRVGVYIYFEDIMERKEFRRVPIRVIPDNIRLSLSQTFIDTVIRGPLLLLDQLQDGGFYAVIDVSDFEFSRNERREMVPRLLHQDKFQETAINPPRITVTFNESFEEYKNRIEEF